MAVLKRSGRRRKPLKRAVTLAQARAQLARYDRLFNEWTLKAEQAMVKIRKYRKKAEYYQQRVNELEAQHLRELEAQVAAAEVALGRELRSVRVD